MATAAAAIPAGGGVTSPVLGVLRARPRHAPAMTSHRRILAVALVSIAAAAVALSLRGCGAEEGADAAGRSSGAPEPEEDAGTLEALASVEAGRVEALAPAAETGPEAGEPELAADPGRVVLLVRVRDAAGDWHASESGELELRTHWITGSGARVESGTLAVEDGRAVLDLGDAAGAFISGGTLGGEAALAARPIHVDASERERVVELSRPVPSTLVVRSAATGAALSDVEVRMTEFYPARVFVDGCGEGRRVASGATSPITLPKPRRSRNDVVLHARAPGHAWGRLGVNLVEGGERLLALEPGGGIEVRVRGEGVDGEAEVRVRRPGEGGRPLLRRQLLGERVVRFEGAPAETLRITLERGEWEGAALFAEAEVEVEAGAQSVVTLDGVVPEPPPEVTIAGEVFVPEAWGVPAVAMMRELVGPPLLGGDSIGPFDNERLEPLGDGRHAFLLERVQAGRHVLRLVEPPWTWRVDARDGGATGLALAVPPPVDVTLRAVDAETGAAVALDGASWTPAPPPQGSRGKRLYQIPIRAGATDHPARVPRALLEFHARQERYFPAAVEADVTRPNQVIEIPLQRAQGVDVTFHDGETRVRLEPPQFRVTRASGERPQGITVENPLAGPARIRVPEPGRYELIVEPPPGYRALDPTAFTLEPGEFTELRVALERNR